MVDLTFLEKFAKGDTGKMKRYISLYLDVAPKTFEEMQRNFADGNWEQLRINAHSLKPQTDFMGITSLKEELIRIEDAVKSNEYDGIENMLRSARSISAESEILLKEQLDRL